jgi:cobaltochelatase CobS
MMSMTKKKTTETVQGAAQTVAAPIPGTDVFMQRRTTPHEKAPHKRPYVFDAKQCRDIARGVRLGMNVMLTGPTGCGKTSVIAALAAELGHPLIRFNCDGETRVSNLKGMMKPSTKDGMITLTFSPGDLAVAMREGWWVLLDEIDAALPSVLFVLQPVLEEGNRTLHIPETKTTVEAHPDFAIFATGNTVGYRASARARHAGTNPMNAAFVDRFGMVIACDYPERMDEIERVRAHVPTLDSDFIDGLCRVAEDLRKDPSFRSDFSTRRLIQCARILNDDPDQDVLYAFELAVIRKIESAADAKVVREVVRRTFGYGDAE